jgi:16S rRNA (guanine1207-N2)-methyltransferase
LKGAGHSAPFALEDGLDEGAVKTLFLPFENGELPFPPDGARFLFLNAAMPPVSDYPWQRALDCVQGFRSEFLALQRAGYRVTPQDGQDTYHGALVLLGKHRKLNRQNIYTALERALPGGPVLIAGVKTLGVQAMRKELAEMLPVEQTLSKNHAQVFWCLRPESWISPPAAAAGTISVEGAPFETAPGMFSHRAVDAGSQMLARHFGDVKGKAADFGAGWGYLSAMLLKSAPAVTALDLYEADFAALEAAKTNVRGCKSQTQVGFHWQDLLSEPAQALYDTIIMNPPFHTGRSAEVSIGQIMIAAAARSLKPGGRLVMVANRELAYEDTLQRVFRRFERIDENRQHKIILAVK